MCRACDLDFSDPLEEAGPSFYDSHALYTGPEALCASRHLLNWDQRRFLADAPAAGGRLLDVGCGTGQFLAAARCRGYHVAGIDPSRIQVEWSRRRFGLMDVHVLSVEEFARRAPLPFDIVTAFQVLEHVADPLAFLGTVRRLLVPGGHVALGVPCRGGWRALRDPLDMPPNHLTRWSAVAIHRALAAAGFDTLWVHEHRSAYNFMLRHVRLGVLRRLMRRAVAGPTVDAAPGDGPAGPGRDHLPSATLLALAVGKARALMALDVLLEALLAAVGAPAAELYALARART